MNGMCNQVKYWIRVALCEKGCVIMCSIGLKEPCVKGMCDHV